MSVTADVEHRLTAGKGLDACAIAAIETPGFGPTLVWLGGFRSDMTGSKAEALAAHGRATGRRVVRFDYSGHGASGGAFEDGTIGRWAAEARAVVEALVPGPMVLVGSSMGGWISLLLARDLTRAGEGARLAGLVLIAPAPDFTEDLMWASFTPEMRETLMRDGLLRRPSDYGEDTVITRALIEDGRAQRLLGAPIDITCPVHILQGVEDPDVPWRHALRLVESIPHGDVVLTLVKDGDHRLSRPEDIARILAAVDGMVEGTAA
ncbi:alpha/beta hydrolase [Methylobrevis pamukkalensis]|uniref:Palmitoyl-protein thioesterase ABHD10, mitochondrial n=1 Tax=Methylobrevis pamukkalensis TaxID=1439726 RepID=A0A1E3H2Y7_9HYPH|nr:alpha/beta hydrolase [Methylobrevis pamukkalensis]ODN70515.1 putative aminoacrylate hydrolase RutD [Methylobrevis pamukkalensis]